MELTRIAIISTDATAAHALAEGLRRVGFKRNAEHVQAYPSRAEVQDLLHSDDPPDVILLDYSQEKPALQCLRDIKAIRDQTLSVMFNGSRRLSSLVKAKQGGVWGYLTDPADLSQLADHFGLAAPAETEENEQGFLVGFLPAQGGSGASTVCLHVAQKIAEGRSGDALLVDCDLHTGTVAFQLGLEPRRTLLDALDRPTRENTRACSSRWGELDVLVGPADPEGMFDGPLDHMNELLVAARQAYGFVIADLPAPIYRSTTDILRSADLIYLVCTPEITSLHLAKRKIDRMRSLEIDTGKLRLLLNRSALGVLWLRNRSRGLPVTPFSGLLTTTTEPLQRQPCAAGSCRVTPHCSSNSDSWVPLCSRSCGLPRSRLFLHSATAKTRAPHTCRLPNRSAREVREAGS